VFDRQDIPVSQRRVIHEGEIERVLTGGDRAGPQIGQAPDRHFENMGGHQDRDRRHHDDDELKAGVGVGDEHPRMAHRGIERRHHHGMRRDIDEADEQAEHHLPVQHIAQR
jgi:hypothetical protein